MKQAQQLLLHRERQLADLVEKQDLVAGPLDISVMSGLGAGEGTLLVAEQLALDQFAGNRRAIDRDEWLIGARRVLVNKTRRDLLADAALAGYQERAVDIGDPRQQHFYLAHCRGDNEPAFCRRLMR